MRQHRHTKSAPNRVVWFHKPFSKTRHTPHKTRNTHSTHKTHTHPHTHPHTHKLPRRLQPSLETDKRSCCRLCHKRSTLHQRQQPLAPAQTHRRSTCPAVTASSKAQLPSRGWSQVCLCVSVSVCVSVSLCPCLCVWLFVQVRELALVVCAPCLLCLLGGLHLNPPLARFPALQGSQKSQRTGVGRPPACFSSQHARTRTTYLRRQRRHTRSSRPRSDRRFFAGARHTFKSSSDAQALLFSFPLCHSSSNSNSKRRTTQALLLLTFNW